MKANLRRNHEEDGLRGHTPRVFPPAHNLGIKPSFTGNHFVSSAFLSRPVITHRQCYFPF